MELLSRLELPNLLITNEVLYRLSYSSTLIPLYGTIFYRLCQPYCNTFKGFYNTVTPRFIYMLFFHGAVPVKVSPRYSRLSFFSYAAWHYPPIWCFC